MTQTQSKILVVGATGTVGSELVKLLVSAGETVKAATRDPSQDLGAGVEPVLYDFDDASTFDGALEGVDRVFYLSRPADPQAAEVAQPLFEKAVAIGVKHIVNMSAMGVETSDEIPMRKVELMLERSGIPFTVLRPNWFMQNFSVGFMSDMVRDQGALFLPAGDVAVSFIDTRDIAAVAAKVLTDNGHERKFYTLTGGEALTFEHVATALSQATKRSITYSAISDDDMKSALRAQGWPDAPIEFMLGLFWAMQNGHNTLVGGDVQQILGRNPRTLSDFMAEFSGSL